MPHKILVSDDSEIARLELVRALQAAGFDTLEAESGDQALKIVLAQPVDLVITDVRMPVMTGIEFCEALRDSVLVKKPPVLVVSTESSAELKDRAKRAGVKGWIIKPASIVAVVAAVKALIAKANVG